MNDTNICLEESKNPQCCPIAGLRSSKHARADTKNPNEKRNCVFVGVRDPLLVVLCEAHRPSRAVVTFTNIPQRGHTVSTNPLFRAAANNSFWH